MTERKEEKSMQEYQILAVRPRYIIPFQWDTDKDSFENKCSAVDAHTDYPYSFFRNNDNRLECHWERASLERGEQDVYGYIIKEFSQTKEDDGVKKNDKAGMYWNYQSLTENPFRLKVSKSKNINGQNENYDIAIVDMGLYVFRSGVGFLWYEIKLDIKQITDSRKLIHFQNKFKELDRGSKSHLWIKRTDIQVPELFGEGEWIPFLLGNWIAERLEFLDVSYQAERTNSYPAQMDSFLKKMPEEKEKFKSRLPKKCPDKALLFTYIAFDREKDWTMGENEVRTAYYLTNGYKESYEMGDGIQDVVRKPFSNVIWMATREGCGYYAWAGENNRTFFKDNQCSKIMNDYFLLYIRTIYQSYSLMKYAVYTSEKLSNDYDTYLQVSEDTEQISDQISKIGAEISLFLVKSMATSVSHIQHQNDFYGYLNEQLQIKEDAASVTAGLSALNELQKETEQKKQKQIDKVLAEEKELVEQREKEADNTFQIGLGLMTFLAVISAVTDGYGIMDSLQNNTLSTPWMIGFTVLFVICGCILAASIVIFIKSVRNLKGKGKGK